MNSTSMETRRRTLLCDLAVAGLGLGFGWWLARWPEGMGMNSWLWLRVAIAIAALRPAWRVVRAGLHPIVPLCLCALELPVVWGAVEMFGPPQEPDTLFQIQWYDPPFLRYLIVPLLLPPLLCLLAAAAALGPWCRARRDSWNRWDSLEVACLVLAGVVAIVVEPHAQGLSWYRWSFALVHEADEAWLFALRVGALCALAQPALRAAAGTAARDIALWIMPLALSNWVIVGTESGWFSAVRELVSYVATVGLQSATFPDDALFALCVSLAGLILALAVLAVAWITVLWPKAETPPPKRRHAARRTAR